jgi:cell division protein FtsQ
VPRVLCRGSPPEVEHSRVDRSFAARPGSASRVPPIGGLTRPLSWALPRGATAKRLGIALAALALLGGGWLLLRKSPLVSVEHVQIAGVQGVDAGQIDAALRGAARGMSTLTVNVGALRAAVAPFHVVRKLSISTSFPHGLRIHVVEQLPVAAMSVGGTRTAVAGDGAVLGPDLLASERVPLPAITLAAGSPAPLGGHVENAIARAELTVLGAAPRVLLGWVSKVFKGPEGLTVAMRNGVSIYFGDATRPHAKWLSAARVLADPSSAGATYVDVRAPERPAAGTTAAGGLAGDTANGQASASDTDATSAALANVLAEAISGGSGTESATESAAAASSAAGSSATASPSAASGATASGAASSVTEPGTTEASAANSGASAGAGASEAGSAEPSATGVTGSG